jgi:predicted transcriptional regulator of viral defense system
MQNSKAEKLRKLASKRQIVSAKDARELGIPRTYLPRLARRGDLERVGRGLHSSRNFSGTESTASGRTKHLAAFQDFLPRQNASLIEAAEVIWITRSS